MSFVKTIAINK